MNWAKHAASEHPNCDYSCCKAFLHPAAFRRPEELEPFVYSIHSAPKITSPAYLTFSRPQPWELGKPQGLEREAQVQNSVPIHHGTNIPRGK
jgi:hypothetical protein